MKYFIANWKANKNINECEDWLKTFIKELESSEIGNTVIICPPHPFIYFTKQLLKNTCKNVYLGTQDLSCFEKGSFTGEVTVSNLENLINYAIIGHSERRKFFNENDEILSKKTILANKYHIEPIFCIRGTEDMIPDKINFIAYEPVEAIGTGNNESLEKILDIKNNLKLPEKVSFLYGGSVNENNAREYLKSPEIDGLLIGTASLDPREFMNIIKKAED